MKTKKESQKKEASRSVDGFNTVKTFRKIKEKISKDLQGMSFEEMKEYLKKESVKLQAE